MRIAAGGVGQVWRATDLLLERPVAVKVLRPEYSDHPETLERFRKEAKNAGALSNPHVAQVYDYGPDGPSGSPYLVMEFVDGPSLADLLAVGPIEPAGALDIISQAAEGLSAAHRAGLVHRDVKPGNILIGKDGLVKVTDFGIAYAVGQAPVTSPGLVMGTTQYIAPERIAGDPGSAASDVYALGIVLHECLTGVPPHDGTPADVMAAHLYLPLPPLPAGVPPELDDLVSRLTVKDPAKRISDATELSFLAAGLRDLLSGVTSAPAAWVAQSGASPVVAGPVVAGTVVAGPVSQAVAVAEPGRGGVADFDDTLVLPPGRAAPGPGYVSDEWAVPSRMSLPVVVPGSPPPGGAPEDRRKWRTGAFAVSAAVVATVGMVVLLVSGAFSGTSDANQGNTGVPAPATSTSARASSHPASPRAPATAAASATASAAATTPQFAPSSEQAPASPTEAASTTAAAPTDSASSASSTPSGTLSSTPDASQSATSSPSASASPTPSATPTVCILGLCF
jgi:eukaryotic-like serine/threonine-protein kinase